MTTRRAFLAHTASAAVALGAATRAIAAADASDAISVDLVLLKRAVALLEHAPLIDTHNDLPTVHIDESAG